MKVVGGSVEIGLNDRFIHSGYTSAYMRSAENTTAWWTPYGGSGEGELVVQSVSGALALEEGQGVDAEALVQVHSLRHEPPAAGAAPGEGHVAGFWWAAGGVSAVVLAALLVLRRKRARSFHLPSAAGLMLLVFGVSWFTALSFQPEAKAEPGKAEAPPLRTGMEVLSYERPEAATRLILMGIVGPALTGTRDNVERLEEVAAQVALPVANGEMTAGMAYATAAYWRDGWGRALRLGGTLEQGYRVTSAGPDGEFDTADDMALALPAYDRYDWEPEVSGLFLLCNRHRWVGLIHRVERPRFQTAHAGTARTLAGNVLFDLIPLEKGSDLGRELRISDGLAYAAHMGITDGTIRPGELYFVSAPRPRDGHRGAQLVTASMPPVASTTE